MTNLKPLDIQGNLVILQREDKEFASIGIQGDTFFTLKQDLAEALACLDDDVAESKEILLDILDRLTDTIDFYEKSLSSQNLSLPYHK